MKINNPTPFRYKSNPAKSPFKKSAFDTEMDVFRSLPTGPIEVQKATGGIAPVSQAKNQEFDNFYKDMKNPYENMNMENLAEDLTVNQQQAEFEKQQAMQSEANIMQGMQGAAGGSGIAGLAQAMSNQSAQRAQRASASIGQQEAANQQARVAGAQDVQRRRELQAQGQGQTAQLKAAGATAAQTALAQSGMQQAGMENQRNIAAGQLQGQLSQFNVGQAYTAASDARNLQFQKSQGMLQLIAGQDAAKAANEQADKNWGQRVFGW